MPSCTPLSIGCNFVFIFFVTFEIDFDAFDRQKQIHKIKTIGAQNRNDEHTT